MPVGKPIGRPVSANSNSTESADSTNMMIPHLEQTPPLTEFSFRRCLRLCRLAGKNQLGPALRAELLPRCRLRTAFMAIHHVLLRAQASLSLTSSRMPLIRLTKINVHTANVVVFGLSPVYKRQLYTVIGIIQAKQIRNRKPEPDANKVATPYSP